MKAYYFVTSIGIIGSFSDEWGKIKEYCEQSSQDSSGIGVGIIKRVIKSDIGEFPVKFLVLFIDQRINYTSKQSFQFTMKDILEEGFEEVLTRIGRKTVIKVLRREKRRKIGT
ncbi:MAG: hypothetical protein ACXAC8_15090 [Candidatus Hodarchaeales archaeon]|jgi:hypothetical protein